MRKSAYPPIRRRRVPDPRRPAAWPIFKAYHPGNQRGLAPAARNGAFSVLQDMGLDVIREFWPEIARKFKMPFRGGGEEQAALHD